MTTFRFLRISDVSYMGSSVPGLFVDLRRSRSALAGPRRPRAALGGWSDGRGTAGEAGAEDAAGERADGHRHDGAAAEAGGELPGERVGVEPDDPERRRGAGL